MCGKEGRRPNQLEPLRKGEILLIDKFRKPFESEKGGMSLISVEEVGL